MSKVLNWGVVGCGKISHDFVKALKNCVNPNRIHALAASKKEKSEKLKKTLNLNNNVVTYGSYKELFVDRNVDIVYVGVQHQLHKEVVLQALEAGKNVLCEKPIGVNTKEAKEMYENAKQKNLFLMEATWSRFFPVYNHIRKIIKDGTLGAILGVGANFSEPYLRDKLNGANEGRTPINETGIYAIQFALWVINEAPCEIFAVGDKNEKGVDTWSQIVLKFPSKSKATLFYSGIDVSPNNAYISFEKGMVEIPGYFWCPEEMIVHPGFVNDKNSYPPPIKFPFNDDDLDYNYSHSTGLRYEADHVYECISLGKKFSNIHSPEESIKIFEILDEIRRQLGVVYPQDN